MVSEENRQLMPESDFEEWEDAMREYRRLAAQGHDPFFVFTYLKPLEFEHYKKCVD